MTGFCSTVDADGYDCLTINDRNAWNAALSTVPYHHVLQTWEWGDFKGRHGWTAERLLFKRGSQTVALAQVLTRRAWPLPWTVMYVPKGPALDYADQPLRRMVLDALHAHARRRHAIFCKIDPDVVLGTGIPGTGEEVRDPLGEEFQGELASRGWRFSTDQIQFRNTVQVDLAQDENALLSAMKQKTRYNVRLASRKSVTVRVGGREDTELLFRMYAETAARDGFIIRPLEYYHDAWGLFLEAGLACPLIAECAGEALAALILFHFGERAWYMYGASRDARRELMPNHLLQWEAIRWARASGYRVYDMWGAPDDFAESDPLWGVWRFKSGFGGRIVRHVGAWDIAASRPAHWLYSAIIPRYLAAQRLLRG